MRIGFYGGSFDPIHVGHLILAQDALERGRLDRIYLVPTAQAPLKKNGPPGALAKDRLAMIRIAIKGLDTFGIITDEIDRGGVSYTVDTVRRLREHFPDDELFWIIGGDQVAQLADWRAIDEICALARFLCLKRPGFAAELPAEIPPDAMEWVSGRQLDVSSTEIRERANSGRPIDFFLPSGVGAYISDNTLYR